MQLYPSSSGEKLCSPHGEPRHSSTVPLKDFELFKLAKSISIFIYFLADLSREIII